MSTPEIHSLSISAKSTISTESTDANPFLWIGREVTNHFEAIGSAISSIFSNITNNLSVSSEPQNNYTKATNITGLPTVILNIIESYSDRVAEIVKCIQNDGTIPNDLQKYAQKIEWLDISKMQLSSLQVINLLDCCENIESLTVGSYFFCSNAYIKEITTTNVSKKIATLENLKHLEVNGYHIALSIDELLDEVTSKKKLHSLELHDFLLITDTSISHIARCKDILLFT